MTENRKNQTKHDDREEPDKKPIRFTGNFYGQINNQKANSSESEEARRKQFDLRAGIAQN